MIIQDYVTTKQRIEQFKPRKRGIWQMDTKKIIMLILRCNAGQSIWINHETQIIVLGHSKGVTRLGIKTPPDTRIDRDEIKCRKGGNRGGFCA